ncbi:RNA-DNA hybrid ribonuclease [Aspergillus undulatus]|uniref:RNA-DNA hybrid ribonuclease n=1 Tax=Aspergillus undulatus TaxID=1810928 RepID=UPI003CCCF258
MGPRGSLFSCSPKKLLIPQLTLDRTLHTTFPRSTALPIPRSVSSLSSPSRTAADFLSPQFQRDVMNETTPSPTPGPATKPSKSPPATAGTKRKRGAAGKYYAVKAGYQPGIYYEWKDCLAQVTGFRGAVFQGFPTIEEANAFLTGAKAPSSRGASPLDAEPTRFYAIQRGHKPGVYTNWAHAQEQIKGFQKPRYKKFSTREEAEEFVKLGGAPVQFAGAPGLTREAPKDKEGVTFEPGEGPLPPGAEDGFDPNVLLDPKTGKIVYKTDEQKAATKTQPKGPPGMLRIYTDGSSLKNGKTGANAGVGVYFGPGDTRFVYLRYFLCLEALY